MTFHFVCVSRKPPTLTMRHRLMNDLSMQVNSNTHGVPEVDLEDMGHKQI